MEFYQILYLISAGLLWICIAINIKQLRRNRRLSKDYLKAIFSANEAREKYLQGCEVNAQIQDELIRDKEYFRNLREQENKNEET